MGACCCLDSIRNETAHPVLIAMAELRQKGFVEISSARFSKE
jgi:hypothetical protein